MKRTLLAASAICLVLVTPRHAAANTPACTTKAMPVLVTSNAFSKSQVVSDMGFNGTATVRVEIDDRGNVSSAGVIESSGNGFLDRDAVRVAQSTAFAPGDKDCPAVAGSYSVLVTYE